MIKQRNTGIDLARAIALFGMVIVNFKLAMNATDGSTWLLTIAHGFEGRASALFVVLAGIGVTFLTNTARQSNDLAIIKKVRIQLINRGVILLVIGLLYVPIWEADILHFYGLYFILAAMLFRLPDKNLLKATLAAMLIFPLLFILLDYGKHWQWSTLSYDNFWTLDGMLRHLFFNGFHPVFPWIAFLLLGMWLGRQDQPFQGYFLSNSNSRAVDTCGSSFLNSLFG